MRRRTFIGKMLFGAASVATTRAFAEGTPSVGHASPIAQNADPTRILKLKGDYYRHYPVDFSKGRLGALGFKGWGKSVDVVAPADETALLAMHIWNVGFSPELPFAPDGPAGPVMQMLEWASRSIPIIEHTIPLILTAARAAGIRVIHVASDESYAKKYDGYKRTLEVAGKEPEGLPRAPRHEEQKELDSRKQNLLFGERFIESLKHYRPYIDFPEKAKPLTGEYVCVTTHQLNEILRKHGIWQLIYVGFALNWCLWFSPAGMVDMSRLGYRCSCIKEAVTAVENKETVRGELNKQQALWRMSTMFGYVHHTKDFVAECERLAREG